VTDHPFHCAFTMACVLWFYKCVHTVYIIVLGCWLQWTQSGRMETAAERTPLHPRLSLATFAGRWPTMPADVTWIQHVKYVLVTVWGRCDCNMVAWIEHDMCWCWCRCQLLSLTCSHHVMFSCFHLCDGSDWPWYRVPISVFFSSPSLVLHYWLTKSPHI